MTRLRTLIVAVAFALFATAFGIALGAGPLQEDIHDAFLRDSAVATPDPAQLRRETALERTVRYSEEAVTTLAPAILASRLQNRPVVVLALPGAARRQVDAVVADINAADGTVTAELAIGAELVDPAARTLVDTLSAGQVEEYDDLNVPAGASVYERVGLVLGRAIATTEIAGEPVDDSARSVLNGFTTAELVSGTVPDQRASLAVVVAGRAGPTDGGDVDTLTARGSIIAALATGLRDHSDGVVVAGPPASARRGGAVAAVRDDAQAADSVSTVDTLNVRLGQVGVILALAEQASGGSGHYGMVDAPDGAMPR